MTQKSEQSRIWRELLHIEKVGRHDNFFELGGHSLLASAAISRLKPLGFDIPLNALYLHPTIVGLASHRAAAVPHAGSEGLIILRSSGSGAMPLFIVHDIAGEVVGFFPLAQALPLDIPVYGLALLEETHATSINLLASKHIETLRTVQQHGPYRIAGYSMGGIIAHEIGVQLKAAGETVQFLGLVDSRAPTLTRHRPEPISRRAGLRMYLINRFPQLDREQIERLHRMTTVEQMIEHCQQVGLFDGEQQAAQVLKRANVLASLVAAGDGHRPQTTDLDVHVYIASSNRGGHSTKGWQRFVPRPITVHVGGTHRSILKEPHVKRLAAGICEAIASRQQTPP